MLSIFRTNQFVVNIFLIFYIVLLRFSTFMVSPEIAPSDQGVLSAALLASIDQDSTPALLLGMLLVFFHAVLINLIVSRYRMASELSLFPGLFYILLASSLPDFLYLSSPLLANTFYIIALLELFGIYKKYNSAPEIFNAGFWIAVGSLFYFSYIIFIIAALIGLANLRAFKVKEAVILIIGFSVPYILATVYYFWTNGLAYFNQVQFMDSFGISLLKVEKSIESLIIIGFFSLLLLISVFSYNRFLYKKNIQVQKYIILLYWCLLISAGTLLLQANIKFDHLLILTIPLGIFLSFIFLKLKPPIAETLHLILLAAILLFQFRPITRILNLSRAWY